VKGAPVGYRSPREFRKHIVKNATEDAVGAVHRPLDGTPAADVVGSRPQPPQAVARSAPLTRAPPWTTPNNYSLSGYSGATSL